MAYVRLPHDQRSIAAAYRAVKGLDPAAPVKTPGHFTAWAKEHCWKEYAAAYDAADLPTAQKTAAAEAEARQTARLTVIEQIERQPRPADRH